MMRKVFLSSTARDLAAYRAAVYQAVERLDDFHCVRMEDFGARDAQADDFCRAKVAECDVAVFIAGLCYGSSPKGSKESYTHREYLAARDTGKPRLVFLTAEGKFYDGYHREPDRLWNKQQAFRTLLNQERIRDDFTTPEELAGKVATALSNWARDHPEQPKTSGKKLKGEVSGSGGLAQGDNAVAAGARGVAVRGNVYGGIHMTSPHPAEPSVTLWRNAYLKRVMERCRYLSLAGIDPAVVGQRDADTQLSLNAVYTALLTRSYRQEAGKRGADPRALASKEKLRSALEQLDRNKHLVLQGDPGSGKSTFANFVALCLAGELLGDEGANLARLTAPLPDEEGKDGEKPQPWRHGALLPVPVVLRDFAAVGLPEHGFRMARSGASFPAGTSTSPGWSG